METTSVVWFWPRKEGEGLDGILFSAENKQDFFHLYYFIQLEGEESLPTMRTDGKQKGSSAAGEAAAWPSELHKAQWATGPRAPRCPMTTCTAAKDTDWFKRKKKKRKNNTHTYAHQNKQIHTVQDLKRSLIVKKSSRTFSASQLNGCKMTNLHLQYEE